MVRTGLQGMSPNSTSITDPLPAWQRALPGAWLPAPAVGADPGETPPDAPSRGEVSPSVAVSPLLCWLQCGANPAGRWFLSNIRELPNWTKRLQVYSVPASAERVFGLVVLLKRERLSAAPPLHEGVSRGAAPALVPKCGS